MRAFIAIDFGRQLKNEIAVLQSKLREQSMQGRWKYIDNFHLTLKFLDEVEPPAVKEIDELLKTISGSTGRFTLKISELGNFPGNGCLRVLWLGLGGELDRLRRLQGRIDSELQKLGFSIEKRGYTPHVTIGQDIRFDKDFESIKAGVNFRHMPEIHVDRIYLFKSEQLGNKRVYTPVREYAFACNGL